MISLALPMIYNGKFDQRDRQLLDQDVLKNSHQRDLISHLDPDIIAKQGVEQL